jgi:hypothetical protein
VKHITLSNAKRAAQAMGYQKVITYTLEQESGASLFAAGWQKVGATEARSWDRTKRARTDKHPTVAKTRWEAA